MSNNGYIYLLWTREFYRHNEKVYKIGRTIDLFKRMSQYPQGSKLLLSIASDNLKTIELSIIKKFSQVFKARIDIGREYFEGDVSIMIDLIIDIVKTHNDSYCYLSNDPPSNPQSNNIKDDPTIQLMEYVKLNQLTFSSSIVKSKQFYLDYINWINNNSQNSSYLSHTQLTRLLVKCYGVCPKPHRFDDGVEQSLVFPKLVPDTVPEDNHLHTSNHDTIFHNFLKHIYLKHQNNTEVTLSVSELLDTFNEFTIKEGLVTKQYNTITFGFKLKQLAKAISGIQKQKNIGSKKLQGYSFDINTFQKYIYDHNIVIH